MSYTKVWDTVIKSTWKAPSPPKKRNILSMLRYYGEKAETQSARASQVNTYLAQQAPDDLPLCVYMGTTLIYSR
jgi:hypothetical protein